MGWDIYSCIYIKPLLPYKYHHRAEEEGGCSRGGRGLEMSTDLMGWEGWRRGASSFRSPVNSRK